MRLKGRIWEDLNRVYKKDLLVEEDIKNGVDLEDEPPSDEEDLWYETDPPLPGAEDFAENIYKIVQDILDSEQRDLSEAFTSKSCCEQHFKWHCLAGKDNRRSTHTNIYYDFDNRDKYRLLEDSLSTWVRGSLNSEKRLNFIWSLMDTASVLEGFRRLFEGSTALYFSPTCGFKNEAGPVGIAFITFANNYTQNYTRGNTIHCLVQGKNGKTITLYPVDADQMEKKFNGYVRDYRSKYNQEFISYVQINH